MNRQIRSYNELVQEKKRLELLVEEQKQVLYHDIQQIKEELQPVYDTLGFLKRIATRDKTSLLLTIGSDIAINTIFQKFILSKAGWFAKTVIPYFLRNYSSHFVAEHKDQWLEKLKNWLSHKNGNGYKENSYADGGK